MVKPHLENYRALVAKVDALCGGVVHQFGAHLACREGCDDCCRHLELFPVEAAALAQALMELPAAAAAHIRRRAAQATAADPCPLLEGGSCLLYAARPLICRTHGLALLAGSGADRRIDYCPKNFVEIKTLPAAAVVDLERLNLALAAVNRLFVHATGGTDASAGERFSIAWALRGDGG